MPNAVATAVKLAVKLAVPERLGRDTHHPYRLKVKELLYVWQLAAGAGDDQFVEDLGEVKDAIGEWHDWEQLALIAQKSLDHGNRCGLVAALKRIAKSKYEYALTLAEALRHKYLQSSRPQKKGASAAKVPNNAVWQATATRRIKPKNTPVNLQAWLNALHAATEAETINSDLLVFIKN